MKTLNLNEKELLEINGGSNDPISTIIKDQIILVNR